MIKYLCDVCGEEIKKPEHPVYIAVHVERPEMSKAGTPLKAERVTRLCYHWRCEKTAKEAIMVALKAIGAPADKPKYDHQWRRKAKISGMVYSLKPNGFVSAEQAKVLIEAANELLRVASETDEGHGESYQAGKYAHKLYSATEEIYGVAKCGLDHIFPPKKE